MLREKPAASPAYPLVQRHRATVRPTAAGKPTPEEGDAAGLAACGGGDGNGGTGPGGGADLAGTYQLVGANGATVPALVTSPVCSPAQVLSGDMKLTAGGRWEMRFEWRDGGTVWFYYDFCNDNQGEDLDLAWSR